MAYADYYHCDVCDTKCFYDANLNWDDATEDKEIRSLPGHSLDYCGDIRALCINCAKTHKVVVIKLEGEK